MKALIAYSSQEGQTRKIAQFICDSIERMGYSAELVDLHRDAAAIDLAPFGWVILAGSVHERRHAPAFEAFIAERAEALRGVKTLLLSVSLNAAFPSGQEDAQDYLDEMKLRTGFAPSSEALVAGAVRKDTYDDYAEQVVELVVLPEGGYDIAKGSREFTDWEALSDTLSAFLDRPA